MPIRVHELAKEFKISTAALKKHLKDLGVIVKSHMSIIEEDTVIMIRKKFNAQFDATKKIEKDRKQYYKKRKEMNQKKDDAKKRHDKKTPSKKDDNKSDPNITFSSKPAYEKKASPVKKTESGKPKSTSYKKPFDKKKKESTYKGKRTDNNFKKKDKNSTGPKIIKEVPIDDITKSPERKNVVIDKDKKKPEDFGDKSKHLKNKMKKSKTKKKYKYSQFSDQEEAKIQQNIKNVLIG